MKKQYLQTTLIFGTFIPLLACLFGLIVINITESRLTKNFAKQKIDYAANKDLKRQLNAIKTSFGNNEQYINKWQNLVSENSHKKMSTLLSKAKDSSSTKTLEDIEFSRSTKSGSDANGINSDFSTFTFTLQGTFKELQECFFDIERNMPNSLVNSLTIKPHTSGKFLQLNANYIVWESTSK